MLKTIRSPDKPDASRNNRSRLVFSRNNNSRPASGRNDGDGEVDRISVSGNGVKHAKKSEKASKSLKLSKSRKSKGEKMFKSQNLAKLEKKLSKSGNSTNSNATEDGSKFLISDARTVFTRLRIAFIEALILQHFDLKCHIWIETDASGYVISGVLSQLTSGTKPDGIDTKADLDQWHAVVFFLRKMILIET